MVLQTTGKRLDNIEFGHALIFLVRRKKRESIGPPESLYGRLMQRLKPILPKTPLRNYKIFADPQFITAFKTIITYLSFYIITSYLACYTQYYTINEYNKQLESLIRYTGFLELKYPICMSIDQGFPTFWHSRPLTKSLKPMRPPT